MTTAYQTTTGGRQIRVRLELVVIDTTSDPTGALLRIVKDNVQEAFEAEGLVQQMSLFDEQDADPTGGAAEEDDGGYQKPLDAAMGVSWEDEDPEDDEEAREAERRITERVERSTRSSLDHVAQFVGNTSDITRSIASNFKAYGDEAYELYEGLAEEPAHTALQLIGATTRTFKMFGKHGPKAVWEIAKGVLVHIAVEAFKNLRQ